MKYRAQLEDVPGLKRPEQNSAESLQPVLDWAQRMLKIHPQGVVRIYKSTEILIETIPADGRIKL